jgi:DNA-binding GntR family transcriptional regulator
VDWLSRLPIWGVVTEASRRVLTFPSEHPQTPERAPYNWRMPEIAKTGREPAFYRTAQAVVADRLRRAILSGQLAPGSRLLQSAIAEEMGTSTTPVREAVRELAGEGLLHVDPHRGVVVHQPRVDLLQEVYGIRLLLEPVAIAATVENITPGQLSAAKHILEEMDRESDPAEWAILNASYHSLLAEASRMPILTPLLEKLRNISTVYVASLLHLHPDVVRKAQAEHWALLEACKARDLAKAQELEIAHLQHVLVIGETLVVTQSGPATLRPVIAAE